MACYGTALLLACYGTALLTAGMLRDSLTAAPTLEVHMVTLFVLP